MRKVTLFWNHICILHNFEKQYLSKVKQQLLQEDIDLDIHYFGLGYPSHMCEYLSSHDDLPDLIVSADLEVIENHKIYNHLGDLHACSLWLESKHSLLIDSVQRNEYLLPLVIIPLIYYAKIKDENLDILSLTKEHKLSFGGINNSAVKTIVKSLWQQKGPEFCDTLLSDSHVYDMPINAFQSVRAKQNDIALVPSLYGLRADQQETFMYTPKEGPFLLPSYFIARKSIDEDLAKYVLQKIMQKELLDFYVQQGDLISCINNTTLTSTQEKMHRCMHVKQSFIDTLDDSVFYDFYLSHFPNAHDIR